MKKKAAACILILLILFFGGCWNYRGLDEMSIVSGLAIDKGTEENPYRVSYQIIDLMGNVDVEGINGKLLESDGKTLFDACRNAKKSIVGKLYFGHTQVVVISEQMARENDLLNTVNWLLHDSEPRETLKFVISREENAKDILANETLTGPIAALEISKYIEEDNKITASTSYKQLYEVYNTLIESGCELTLPAIRNIRDKDRTIPQICGTAVFKGQRLIGYLTPDESKYYLFAVGEINGGLFTFPADGSGPDDITLEISANRTSRSVSYENGKPVILIKTETDAFLAENNVPVDATDKRQVDELEKTAAKTLAQRMVQTIQYVQTKFGSDIFGFGKTIHKTEPALWDKFEKDWDSIFAALEVRVSVRINIVNSGLTRQ